jgi:hypothetical protein
MTAGSDNWIFSSTLASSTSTIGSVNTGSFSWGISGSSYSSMNTYNPMLVISARGLGEKDEEEKIENEVIKNYLDFFNSNGNGF